MIILAVGFAFILLIALLVALVAIAGALDKINTVLAVSSTVQLAYLKHSDDARLEREANMIMVDLLKMNGLTVIGKPEGEVEPKYPEEGGER